MRSFLSFIPAAFLFLGLPAAPPHAASRAADATDAAADRLVLPAPKAGHDHPLAVVVAAATGAETTDFVIPFGVLKESRAAEMRSLATEPGPIRLMPALTVVPDQTTEEFDATNPEGADIVFVPAQHRPDDPVLAAWIEAQSQKGAVVVSICEGARTLAHAGLLRGRHATTHWHALSELARSYPDTVWVRDRRYVQDGNVVSTAGVSASLPASLAIVEAIAGRGEAEATAGRLGVTQWGSRHSTGAFHTTAADYVRGLGKLAAFWAHESVEVPLSDGIDEIALAFRADIWGRTYQTKVVTTQTPRAGIRSRRGLAVVPDAEPNAAHYAVPAYEGAPAGQIETALADLHRRYGSAAERFARLGLEYDSVAGMASPADCQKATRLEGDASAC
jgi:transcriptional regulator GlxA family with amidase domain